MGGGGKSEGPGPAFTLLFHKNTASRTSPIVFFFFFFFFSSLSRIPFFRFQLKIRKLKKGLNAAKAYKCKI